VSGNGLVLRELASGVTLDEVISKTGCPIDTSTLSLAAAR
jgi:acyl CoA:acetate/3-ketoacid CoA transferase beta subunit